LVGWLADMKVKVNAGDQFLARIFQFCSNSNELEENEAVENFVDKNLIFDQLI